jgi:TolB-like protein
MKVAIAFFSRWRATGNATRGITSLAVLPMENLSGDPEQEFFADGMTDELITMIAKSTPLRVISRSSVMRFKVARMPAKAWNCSNDQCDRSRQPYFLHQHLESLHNRQFTHRQWNASHMAE